MPPAHSPHPPLESVRDGLRGALPAALKARDTVAVAALRSALAAIDNAEAVDIAAPVGPTRDNAEAIDIAAPVGPTRPAGQASPPDPASSPEPAPGPAASPDQPDTVGNREFAGTVVGVGAAEAERRSLSEAEMQEIVRREVADREQAARTYAAAGQQEPAERLRAEAEVLSAFLGTTDPPPG